MKILVLNYEYPPVGGGGGVFCRDLCEEWVRRGHLVVVITSRIKEQKKIEKINGVLIYRVYVGKRSDLNKASFLNLLLFIPFGLIKGWQILSSEKFDFINTHFAIPTGPIGFVLQKVFRIKNILTVHGADIFDPSRKMSGDSWWLTRWIVAKVINSSTFTIASTNDIKLRAYQKFNIKKEIKIIPLGFLPPEKELKKKRDKLLKTKKIDLPLKLITVGRLVKRKNLMFCLKIIADFQNSIQLKIIGEGPERKELEDFVREKKIKNVIFLGRLSEKEKYQELIKSDVFISTSLHEGFGVVFLEALWSGLLIIASNVGGQIYFLKDNKQALFFENNNYESLKEILKKVIKNKNEILLQGRKNCSFSKKFHIANIADNYLKLIEKDFEKQKSKSHKLTCF